MSYCFKHFHTVVALTLPCLALGIVTPVGAQSSGQSMNGMSNMPGMGGMTMPMDSGPAKPGAGPKSEAVKPQPPKPLPSQNAPSNMHTVEPMDKSTSFPAMKSSEAGTKDMSGEGMDSMGDMQMGRMQGGRPPPNARNPDAYAEGVAPMSMPGMEMSDDRTYGRVLANELEYASGHGERGQNVNLEAWYGSDYNKLWVKGEGKRRNGSLENFRSEALWDHAISTFWSSQLGLRHDNGRGPSRNWLALGVQGIAPYWFETEATAYVGRNGSLAARAEVRYELLFTQKLILQPKFEANFYSKSDPERRIGSGLSDIELGVRLRYEVSRQFAPYIGVTWDRKVGNTANFARAQGERVGNTQLVAGVRLWF